MAYVANAGAPVGIPPSIGNADHLNIAPAANEAYGTGSIPMLVLHTQTSVCVRPFSRSGIFEPDLVNVIFIVVMDF